MKGTIKTLKPTFGFITVEGQDKDLFFHSSETSQFESLQEGDKVEFDEGEGRRGDTVAVTVQKIEQ
ncbi:hypothetical protein ES703_10928 [subsurface metagenome]